MLLEGLGVLLAPLLLDGGGQAVFWCFRCAAQTCPEPSPLQMCLWGTLCIGALPLLFLPMAVEANYFHYLFACLFSLSEVKLSVV